MGGGTLQNRLVWADAAKGLSIVLVVLWHTTDKHLQTVANFLGASWTSDFWVSASIIMTPARMPLFFLISGMFAASAIRRSWAEVYRRPLNHYYIHVIWLALSVPLALLIGSMAVNPVDSPKDWILGLFFGATGPWYIFALAIFFVGAKACATLSPWIPLAFTSVAAVVAYSGFGGPGNFHYLMENAPFFLAGAYYPHLVIKIAAVASWRKVIPASFLALVLGWIVTIDGLPLFPVFRLVAAAVGATALLALVVCASKREGPLTRSMVWVGQRTLGTYLLHNRVLVLIQLMVLSSGLQISAQWGELVGFIYVPLVVVIATLVSIGLTALLKAMRLGFLFEIPGFARMGASSRKRRQQGIAGSVSRGW